MNLFNADDVSLTDLADGTLAGPEWDAWLAAHPAQAAEVAIARRVRSIIAELQAEQIEVPVDFEARLLAVLSSETTVTDLLDLGLGGFGRTLIELLTLLFGLLPAQRTTQPA